MCRYLPIPTCPYPVEGAYTLSQCGFALNLVLVVVRREGMNQLSQNGWRGGKTTTNRVTGRGELR